MMKNQDDQIIEKALQILASRLKTPGQTINSPEDARNYLILKLAELEHEVFYILFMDTRLQVIEFSEMFRGTLNGSSVHPREVVKKMLVTQCRRCFVCS